MNAKYFTLLLLLSTILIQSGTSLMSIVFDVLDHVVFGRSILSKMGLMTEFFQKYLSTNTGSSLVSELREVEKVTIDFQQELTKLESLAVIFPNKITRIMIFWQKIPLQYLHNEIIDHFKFIDRAYNAAMKFMERLGEKHNDVMLPETIELLTGFKRSHLFGEVNELRTIIAPPFPGVLVKSYPSILAIQLRLFDSSHCGDQSFQFSTLEFLAWIFYMERKALAAGIIGYQLFSTHYTVNTTFSMERLHREYGHAHTNYHRVFGNELKNISTAIRACDENTSGLDMTQNSLWLTLDKMESDSRNNKVITGLKFMRNGDRIMIAIAEAKLLPHGKIEENKDYKQPPQSKNAILLKKNIMNFDDIKLPEDYVMTGIQFYVSEKKETSGSDEHIEMRIYGTPFDFKSGKLNHEKTKSFQSPNYHEKEVPVSHNKDSDNLKCDQPLQPNSRIDEYVRFSAYDYGKNRKYVAPLFDNQQVTSVPMVPLGGAGIFIKTFEGCEGFIAFRVFTLDYSDYFDDVEGNLPDTIFP